MKMLSNNANFYESCWCVLKLNSYPFQRFRIGKWGWQFFPDFFCKFPAAFVNLLLGVLAAFRDSFVVGQADFGKISRN
jgi:hypothetical protein